MSQATARVRTMLSMRTLVTLLLATVCWSQQIEFEVASVKPANPANPAGRGSTFNRQPGGGLHALNVTLREMITFAYDLRDHQLVGGPPWMDNDRYDVVAKNNHGDGTDDKTPFEDAFRPIRLRMKALLASRFALAVHTETREMPIYALVVAKNGPHLQATTSEGLTLNNRNGLVIAKKASMQAFADRLLSYRMGRSVVDKTGLSGEYDFEIKFVEDRGAAAAADVSGPDFLTAMQEQLGLKLEQQKGPVPVLLVDHAEKPSAN